MDGDNIGLALTETLHNAIEAELHRQQRPAHHFVNFALTAHSFMHAYQTGNFTVGEFLQWTARLDEMLAKLASKLNSNESFNPECGFQADVVCPCQVRVQVEVTDTTLDVGVWTEKTRKKDASSPSKTEMHYAVLAPSSPCECIVTKGKEVKVMANGKI